LNLVVEFDREEITAYLEGLNVQGEIEVVVEGTFPVTCSDDSFIIDKERSVSSFCQKFSEMTLRQKGFSSMSYQSLDRVYRERRRSMTDRREFNFTLTCRKGNPRLTAVPALTEGKPAGTGRYLSAAITPGP
jgi:hypothetical protein